MTRTAEGRPATGDARRRRRAPAFVVDLFDHVVGNPVREGGLLARGWPPGLAGISLTAAIGYVLIATVVLTSPLLRRVGGLVSANGEQTIPDVALPVLLAATVLALALIQTAALHGHRVGRLAVLALFGSVMLQTAGFQVGALGWYSLAALAGVVVLVIARWRRTFRQWEFLAVLACTIVGILPPLWLGGQTAAVLGFDQRSLNTVLLIGSVTILAYPTILLSGAALTEVAVTTAGWFSALVRGRLRGRAWAGFVTVVVLGRVVEVGWSIVGGERCSRRERS